MFDVGFWELLVIGLIALVVLGPERLPELARTVGLWMGRARAAFYSVRQEVEREINTEGLRETQRAVQREMKERTRAVAKAAGITDDAAEEQTPFSPLPSEERAPARASERKVPSHRADNPSPPSSQDSANDGGEADYTERNNGQ